MSRNDSFLRTRGGDRGTERLVGGPSRASLGRSNFENESIFSDHKELLLLKMCRHKAVLTGP